MSALKNLVGERFGRLEVVGRLASTPAGQARWLARCACGNEVRAPGADLRQGRTTSCGCSKAQQIGVLRLSHGHTVGGRRSPEHVAWANMIARCRPESEDHALYFDRGILVCPEWQHDFAAFFAHIGSKPSPDLSVDRIDNNRGYEPGNVRWATAREQRLNQRGMKVAA